MCYYLCVLRWLMRPILALNCLLQIEQERPEEESYVGGALALAFRCARFCSASLILFASYSPAPLFMPRHFVRSCAICSHDSVGKLKSLREAFLRNTSSVSSKTVYSNICKSGLSEPELSIRVRTFQVPMVRGITFIFYFLV